MCYKNRFLIYRRILELNLPAEDKHCQALIEIHVQIFNELALPFVNPFYGKPSQRMKYTP